MSPHDSACLQRAWPIIGHLISLLQIYVPRLLPNASQCRHWQRLTRVAESLVRRWLLLKACQTPWPNVQLGHPTSPPKTPAKAGVYGPESPTPPAGKSTPLFRLTEPYPAMPVFTYDLETGLYILAPNHSARALNLPSAFNPANLRRRCAALQAVMDDPARHVARMARWLARAAQRHTRTPCRTNPLGIGAPPGASYAQKRQDPEQQNLLFYLHDLACQALARQRSP